MCLYCGRNCCWRWPDCGCHSCEDTDTLQKYIEWCGITIEHTEDGWIKFDSMLPNTIEEWTGCITIKPETVITPEWCEYINYVIDIENKDQLVAMNAACDPTFLWDQIIVDAPLEKNLVWCQMKISIDETKLNHPQFLKCEWWVESNLEEDDVVATPVTIRDAVKLWHWFMRTDWPGPDSTEIQAPSWCSPAYIHRDCGDECSCERQGVVQLRMIRDAFIEQPVWREPWDAAVWYYLLVNTTTAEALGTALPDTAVSPWLDTVEDFWWRVEVDEWPLLWFGNWLICNSCLIPRLVEISRQGTVEASWWVNWLRAQIFKTCEDWSVEPVTEWRDSPISDPDLDWDWLPDNYVISSQWWTIDGIGQWYKYQERQTINMKAYTWLEPKCCLYSLYKVSSTVWDDAYDIDAYPNAQASILGQTTIADVSAWWDLWALMMVKTIDDCCMLNEHLIEDCPEPVVFDPITGDPLGTSNKCYDESWEEVPCITYTPTP